MDVRLLVACGSCRRQYDVGGMKTGEHVRCRCGAMVTVPVVRPHEARVLHCSGCGGKLRASSRRCEYCACEITVRERNLGPACPECFGRLAGGARFCSECGIEIRPEALKTVRASARCPRCKGELLHHEVPEGQYTECGSCGGMWLDPSSFQRVVDTKDAKAFPFLKQHEGGDRAKPDGLEEVRYVPCPTCSTLMNRKNFSGSGVIIDWCKGHGFWFDVHELEKVVEFVCAGGLDRARKAEIDTLNRKIHEAKVRTSRGYTGELYMGTQPRVDWISVLAAGLKILSRVISR